MAKHYGEDLCFEQDAITIQKYKNGYTKKSSLSGKPEKGSLGNIERPGGLKTRKGAPGKN